MGLVVNEEVNADVQSMNVENVERQKSLSPVASVSRVTEQGLIDRFFDNRYEIIRIVHQHEEYHSYLCHAIHRTSRKEVAIKVMHLVNDAKLRSAQREYDVLTLCRNEEGILQLLESYWCPNQEYMALVTEWHDTDLWNAVCRHFEKQGEGVPIEVASRLCYQLAKAVEKLHRKGYCHRDIKAENILLDSLDLESANIILCDFGLAGDLLSPLNARCGSPDIGAPEVFANPNNNAYDGQKVDVWGVGILLFTMVTTFVAWRQPSVQDRIYELWVSSPNDFFSWCSQHSPKPIDVRLATLFVAMCHPQPEHRKPMKDIIKNFEPTANSILP